MKRCWMALAGVCLVSLLATVPSSAQDQGDKNCADFATQIDAQSSLNTSYPNDPNGLDQDSDGVACEDYFKLSDEEAARVVPANLASSAVQSTPAPIPGPEAPSSLDNGGPTPDTGSATTSSRIEPPADLMAQVATCEVVAVSSRSIAAAGCPGTGSIVLRPPAGTPRMRSQVIIRPGAAFGVAPASPVSSAQVAHHDKQSGEAKSSRHERPGKKHQITDTAQKKKSKDARKQPRTHAAGTLLNVT